PHANPGLLRKPLRLTDFRNFAVDVDADARGANLAAATRVLRNWLADAVRDNPGNFRLFGPDDTASNRHGGVFDVTAKQWNAAYEPFDEADPMRKVGKVLEMLSEHQCQGWLEGYLLT